MIRSTIWGLCLAIIVLASPEAWAGKSRITRGDVTAVLTSFETAGRKLFSLPWAPGSYLAAPADGFGAKGSIRPFPGSPWDGATLCAEDWHVVLIAWFSGPSRQAAIEDISPIVNQLWLNGVQLETQRTAINRVLEVPEPTFGYQEGVILSPEDLPAGSYELRYSGSDPRYGTLLETTIFFSVDPSGAPACN